MSAIHLMIDLVRYDIRVNPTVRDAAIAELQRLRAAESEADALRAERDEFKRKVSELELSAENGTAIVRENTELRATVAEQARKIERMTDAHNALCAALDILHFSGSVDGLGAVADARALWLAANAPTPAPEAVSAPRFANAYKYREALEHIERVWVDESIADEHIAALKMYTTAARVLNNADDETNSAPEAEQELCKCGNPAT